VDAIGFICVIRWSGVPLAELNLTKPFESTLSFVEKIEPSPDTYSSLQDTEKRLSFE
jgi:hypothetical protein